MSRAARVRRWPVLAVIAALLAAGVWLDRGSASTPAPARAVRVPMPNLPAPGAVTSAWYCAEGTSNPGGRADEAIVMANPSDRAARAVVSIMSGGAAARRVELQVAGRTSRSVRVADVLAVPDPGVIVEVSGAPAVVGHTITGSGGGVAAGACAREPASVWRFASGTTVRGAQLWLALLNPFPDDAIVDVGFVTDEGPSAPGPLQGLVVPARSRLAVAVHDQVPRRAVVTTQVSVRRGRVVAEQSLQLDGSDGRAGTALSLGSPVLSRVWRFAATAGGDGSAGTLALLNPGPDTVSGRVQMHLDETAALAPQPVTLPPRSVVTLDAGSRVPRGSGYWLEVGTSGPVAAAMLESVSGPAPTASRGIATDPGVPVVSSRWAIVPARVGPSSSDEIVVVNPGGRATTVTLAGASPGAAAGTSAVRRVAVPAGRRVVLDLTTLGVTAAPLVEAGNPVVLERASTGAPGLTVSPAVPDLGR